MSGARPKKRGKAAASRADSRRVAKRAPVAGKTAAVGYARHPYAAHPEDPAPAAEAKESLLRTGQAQQRTPPARFRSKEELQALNEELNTVNQQLQTKVGELESLNNDLKNLLASNEMATLRLDCDMRIKWFSPAACNVLGLIASDVGRAASVFGLPLMGESLIADSRAVLERMVPVQSDVSGTEGRRYLRRTLPYRTNDKRVDGVIVIYTDITDATRAAEGTLASRLAHEALEARVEERTRQLRELAFELTRAEESERQAIARDLHDDLAQLLSLASLKLTQLRGADGDGARGRALEDASALIDRAERAIRSLASQLSPAVLYELGLVPALHWLADEMKGNFGLAVEFRDDGVPKELDQVSRAVLFRAIREMLINVVKHAGVSTARLDVKRADGSIAVTIRDEGTGFDPGVIQADSAGGFGLASARERLSFIGGSAEIVSVRGRGTRVSLTAPLASSEEDEKPAK